MKNKQTNVGSFATAKLQVIIAIAMITVIGFSFTACDEPEPEHVHQWEWTEITPATCVAPGKEAGVCKLDPSHTTTRETFSFEHDWDYDNVEVIIPPACSSTGRGMVSCKRSGCTARTDLNDYFPFDLVNGHDWQDTWTWGPIPPTCTENFDVDVCNTNSEHTRRRAGTSAILAHKNWNTETGLCNDCGALYYSLGDTGPGGGEIFYVSTDGFTLYQDANDTTGITAHYLEAAPADMETQTETTFAWASSAFIPPNIGGTGNWIYIEGTESAIGTGRRNTAIILATDANAPAAKACNDYYIYYFNNGNPYKTDWFLPSYDELNQLYVNRTSVSNLKTTVDNVNNTDFYWSSSQHWFSTEALSKSFRDGDDGYDLAMKSNTFSVRAIRAF